MFSARIEADFCLQLVSSVLNDAAASHLQHHYRIFAADLSGVSFLAALEAAATLATADPARACRVGCSLGGSSALRFRRACCRDAFIITAKGFRFGSSTCCNGCPSLVFCTDCLVVPCLCYNPLTIFFRPSSSF